MGLCRRRIGPEDAKRLSDSPVSPSRRPGPGADCPAEKRTGGIPSSESRHRPRLSGGQPPEPSGGGLGGELEAVLSAHPHRRKATDRPPVALPGESRAPDPRGAGSGHDLRHRRPCLHPDVSPGIGTDHPRRGAGHRPWQRQRNSVHCCPAARRTGGHRRRHRSQG